MRKCAFCDCAIPRGEVACSSSVYGAHEVELCIYCSRNEERIIEEAGTNDVPSLLNSYLKKERES